MSGSWIGALVIGGLALAVATKPSEADFQVKVDNAFAQARNDTWNSGNLAIWAQTALADNFRTARYSDKVVMAEYELLLNGQVAMKCTGMFGSITCG